MEKSQKLNQAFEYLKYRLIIQTKRDIANKLKMHETNLAKQFKNPSDKFLLKFNAAFGNIFNERWLVRDDDGPMLASDAGVDEMFVYRPNNSKPRISFSANAGTLGVDSPSELLSRGEQLPIIPMLPEYDFTIIVGGDSMTPVFVSGDELACRFVKDAAVVRWGRPHVLATRDGVVVKRIYDAGQYFRCVSYNDEEYPEYNIEKSSVFQLALVVGVLRSLE